MIASRDFIDTLRQRSRNWCEILCQSVTCRDDEERDIIKWTALGWQKFIIIFKQVQRGRWTVQSPPATDSIRIISSTTDRSSKKLHIQYTKIKFAKCNSLIVAAVLPKCLPGWLLVSPQSVTNRFRGSHILWGCINAAIATNNKAKTIYTQVNGPCPVEC